MSLFGHHQVMAMIWERSPEQTATIAACAWDAGVELLEVPIGQPDRVPALAAAVAADAERGWLVGVSAAVTAKQVTAAAGAKALGD